MKITVTREEILTSINIKTLLAAAALIGVTATDLTAQDYVYARSAECDEMMGAIVNMLSRKNHFALDCEFKQHIAANTLDWCVGSNHTSFVPQYGSIHVELNDLMGDETLLGQEVRAKMFGARVAVQAHTLDYYVATEKARLLSAETVKSENLA